MTAPGLGLSFRISTYSTLLIACLALGYSEYDLVPESMAFTAVVVVSLVISFVLEGRVALGLGKANLLGLAIGIVAVAWLAIKLTRPARAELANLPWPASLLPYMGPLVIVLIPAKLFRPKHIGDWWTMQGIGLATIVLASSMTDDPFFILLIGLYAVAGVWSLVLLSLNRGLGAIPGLPGKVAANTLTIPGGEEIHGERRTAGRVLLWLLLANAVALPAFYLSPRSTGERWSFAKSRIETGYNPESTHDLTKIGDLAGNTEVAFEVTATNADGTPKSDVDPGQLWRGMSYSTYETGSWQHRVYGPGLADRVRPALPGEAYKPPDLGPGQFELNFHGSEKVAGPVLASPLEWAEDQPSPIATHINGGRATWSSTFDGGFLVPNFGGRNTQHYVQRTRVNAEPGLGPPQEARVKNLEPQRQLLTRMPIPRIREWAVKLLNQLVASGELPKAVLAADERTGVILDPDYHELVAKAFCKYLLDGPFEYSNKLRRVERMADPIEDFLWNAKAGHCERFASGLALALRGLGVPCQYVIGFKGFDPGEEGQYLIRQEHAHAWVEVLITRPVPPGYAFRLPENVKAKKVYHWLTLDPTPGTAAAAEETGNWLERARERGFAFVHDYIVGYNAEKRRESLDVVKAGTAAAVASGVGILVAFWLVRRIRTRMPKWNRAEPEAPTAPTWYRKYLAALRGRALQPDRGETPKEFAERAIAGLRGLIPETTAVLPAFIVSKLYRLRYGGLPLTEGEINDLLSAVATLESAIQSLPTVAPAPGAR